MGLLPPILAALSLLVLAAHFLKPGNVLLAVVVLILIPVSFAPKRWAVRLTQVCLVLATIEWVATTLHYVRERQASGEPFVRLAVILLSVAAVTLIAAALYQLPAAKRRYTQTTTPQDD